MAEQKPSPNSDYGRMTAERDALCQELESYRKWHAAALRMVGSDKDEFDSKPLVEYIQEMKDRLAAAEQAARAAGDDALERAAKTVKDFARLQTTTYLGCTMDDLADMIIGLKSPPSPVAGGPGGAERSKA
jgi:vacuolar-type H+-ATPase catalytic subunit A/Vma1